MEFSNDLVFYTVMVLMFYVVERLRLAQAQQLAAAELKIRLAEAQLENLRLQLQPHFLFNTLNTISAVMYEDLNAADAMLQERSSTSHAARRQLARDSLKSGVGNHPPLPENHAAAIREQTASHLLCGAGIREFTGAATHSTAAR